MALQTLDIPNYDVNSSIFFKIKCEFDPDIQRVLVCSDCSYFSIDSNTIDAEFTQEQYSEFSERLFLNFNKTCFAEVILW